MKAAVIIMITEKDEVDLQSGEDAYKTGKPYLINMCTRNKTGTQEDPDEIGHCTRNTSQQKIHFNQYHRYLQYMIASKP